MIFSLLVSFLSIPHDCVKMKWSWSKNSRMEDQNWQKPLRGDRKRRNNKMKRRYRIWQRQTAEGGKGRIEDKLMKEWKLYAGVAGSRWISIRMEYGRWRWRLWLSHLLSFFFRGSKRKEWFVWKDSEMAWMRYCLYVWHFRMHDRHMIQ